MIVYITEYDPSADSWTASGRFHPVSVRESYAGALEAVPEALRSYVLREYYYRITKWDTETGEKVEEDLAHEWALAVGSQPVEDPEPCQCACGQCSPDCQCEATWDDPKINEQCGCGGPR